MTHSPLAKAFLSSMLVHLTVLLGLSSFWGALRMASPRADLIPGRDGDGRPTTAGPEPVTTSEVTPLTPPEILSKTDVMVAKPPYRRPRAPYASEDGASDPTEGHRKTAPQTRGRPQKPPPPRNTADPKHQSFPRSTPRSGHHNV